MVLYREHLSPINPDVPLDEYLLSHWRSILDNPLLHYFVAEVDGCVVATCNLTIIPNLTHNLQPYGLIENVVTHSDFRRRGLGRLVMEAALATAWDKGCYKVMLLSGSTREDAHRFYDSLGFHGDKKKGYVVYPPTP